MVTDCELSKAPSSDSSLELVADCIGFKDDSLCDKSIKSLFVSIFTAKATGFNNRLSSFAYDTWCSNMVLSAVVMLRADMLFR